MVDVVEGNLNCAPAMGLLRLQEVEEETLVDEELWGVRTGG